jgi:(4S)-4-hydroxy-5-phosphonooxypentane-2,3-dione isomerase
VRYSLRSASLYNEPGCEHFDVSRDKSNPTVFYLYEIYHDQKSIEVHRGSAHYLTMKEIVKDWVISCKVKQLSLINSGAESCGYPFV